LHKNRDSPHDGDSFNSIVVVLASLQARQLRDVVSAAINVVPHRIFGLHNPFRSFVGVVLCRS
jgi:hypothetical protein